MVILFFLCSSCFSKFKRSVTVIILHDQNIFSSPFWFTLRRALETVFLSAQIATFFFLDLCTKVTFSSVHQQFWFCFISLLTFHFILYVYFLFLASVFSLVPLELSLVEWGLFPSITHFKHAFSVLKTSCLVFGYFKYLNFSYPTPLILWLVSH